ncbi:MAG: UDP-N-acetylmuramoyl-L-alanine--D-glutamate ligase, partial [Thermodesulfobacteriota bacterium]
AGRIREILPREKEVPLYSELELAYWFTDAPIVGVTGTNGKTTTVRLVDHVLRNRGYRVFLGGNIGVPLSEYVLSEQGADIIVLEISSFQLELVRDFHPEVAVLLNISPNHLDYHTDLQDYYRSKMRLFKNQKQGDLAIFPAGMQKDVESENWIAAQKKYFDNRTNWYCPGLIGPHNRENIQAASLVCARWGITEQEVENAIQDFKPNPHRLQQVCEKAGVQFVDDSKATTLEALRAALESMDRPVLLLAGGMFKGGDPSGLCGVIKEKVRMIGLFGDSRNLFEQGWKDCAPMFWKSTLQEAVLEIVKAARAGDTVLLSPATSSFDLFGSYKERGEAFQRAILELDESLSSGN